MIVSSCRRNVPSTQSRQFTLVYSYAKCTCQKTKKKKREKEILHYHKCINNAILVPPKKCIFTNAWERGRERERENEKEQKKKMVDRYIQVVIRSSKNDVFLKILGNASSAELVNHERHSHFFYNAQSISMLHHCSIYCTIAIYMCIYIHVHMYMHVYIFLHYIQQWPNI